MRFLKAEAAGGVVLLVAAAVALAWANSPWDAAYHHLFGHDVRHWVNDGAMTLFFLVVGLEIKRELAGGHLRSALLPAVAAVGGMVVPAVLYLAVSPDRGWGIPMATDIAFAVGVLVALGRRVPAGLKLFLLTLAVVDDIGAIVVIAVFYSEGVVLAPLVLAVSALAVVWVLGRRHPAWALAAGVGVWAALYHSGVHATLAGVAVALVLPVVPRIEERLHPWSAFLVVPLFALANAGVRLGGEGLHAGVIVGLVVGKPVGIGLSTWLAVRAGWGRLPEGVGWPQVLATGMVAGIGFTVSLFVAGLAFPEAPPTASVLAASAAAAVLGAAGLTFWTAKT